MDPTLITAGPAVILFRGVYIYTKDPIVFEPGVTTFAVNTSHLGEVDERLLDRLGTIRFTPAGEWDNAGTLLPYGSTLIGTDIFAALGSEIEIHPQTGDAISFPYGAITDMPEVSFAADKTPFGQTTMTVVTAPGASWETTTNNFFELASAIGSVTTEFDPDQVITAPGYGAWGAVAPWDAIQTQDGWTMKATMSVKPIITDESGTVGMRLSNIKVTARCIPVGISESEKLLKMQLQGAGVVRGKSLGSGADDLVVTSGGRTFTVTKAFLKKGQLNWDPENNRVQGCEWSGNRKFTTGTPQPLFTFA